MAWGFGGYGYGGGSSREPAPKRLTLEELLALDYAQQPAPRPVPVTSVNDLPEQDRRRARQDSIWAGLAGLGAGISSGRWDRAAGTLGEIQDIKERAVAGANARQQAEYQQESERRAAAAAQRQREQEASALYGMYERVTDGEDPGGAFAKKAESAARAGSMAELTKLDAEKPLRAAARAKGYDPDAWATTTRLQEELRAEIDRANAAKAWQEGEKARLEEKAKMEADAKLAEEKALRDAGLGVYRPPQYESPEHAGAVAEAQARARAKYGEGGGGASAYGGKVYKQGEKLVLAKPPDAAHPNAYVVPLDGQPQDVGNLRYFTADGVDYVMDKDDPNAGAFEMKRHNIGDPDYPEGSRVPFRGAAAPLPAKPTTAPAAARAVSPGALDRITAAARNAFSFGGSSAPAPKPPPSRPAAPPAKAPAPAPAKLTDQDKAELRDEIAKRYPNLSPQERDAKYRRALQALAGGGG